MFRLNIFFKFFFSPVLLLQNWEVVYEDLLGLLKKNTVSFDLRNGIRLFFQSHLREFFVIDEIWRRHSYDPGGRFQIDQTDTVVDIGAHKGFFTVYAAKRANLGKVFAFEPFNNNYFFLEKNCHTNHCRNVVLQNAAVSNNSKNQFFYSSAEVTVGGSLLKTEYTDNKFFKKQEVRCITLPQIIFQTPHKKINFLKSDCEGAEFQIFLNLDQKYLQKIDKISMEYHNIGGHHVKELDSFFSRHGFHTEIKPEGSVIGMLYAYRIKKN